MQQIKVQKIPYYTSVLLSSENMAHDLDIILKLCNDFDSFLYPPDVSIRNARKKGSKIFEKCDPGNNLTSPMSAFF